MGTISRVIQAVELILGLWQPFTFSWKSTQPALFNCVALGALKSFTKFTGKHLWQSLSFDKLANYRLAALLKKRLQCRCLHVNFMKFLQTAFLQNENYCFCNKTSTETSFKKGCQWVPWFEHRGNSSIEILSQHQASFPLSSVHFSLFMAFGLLLKCT